MCFNESDVMFRLLSQCEHLAHEVKMFPLDLTKLINRSLKLTDVLLLKDCDLLQLTASCPASVC